MWDLHSKHCNYLQKTLHNSAIIYSLQKPFVFMYTIAGVVAFCGFSLNIYDSNKEDIKYLLTYYLLQAKDSSKTNNKATEKPVDFTVKQETLALEALEIFSV